jgi:glycosyltransferase involved in cell wall biosynthesis
MLYLYAISDTGPSPEMSGLEDAPLRAIRQGDLVAVASEHDELRLRPEESAIWAHEAVVETLMEAGPVLPMRLGSTAEGPDSVVALLRERAVDFGHALEHVRGAVELGVRAALTREPAEVAAPVTAGAGSGGSGADYMLDRLNRKRAVDDAGARIRAALGPLARDQTSIRSSHERMSLRTAFLVDRGGIDEFVQAAEQLEDERDDLTLVCTGPWPPYSFTAGAS